MTFIDSEKCRYFLRCIEESKGIDERYCIYTRHIFVVTDFRRHEVGGNSKAIENKVIQRMGKIHRSGELKSSTGRVLTKNFVSGFALYRSELSDVEHCA